MTEREKSITHAATSRADQALAVLAEQLSYYEAPRSQTVPEAPVRPLRTGFASAA